MLALHHQRDEAHTRPSRSGATSWRYCYKTTETKLESGLTLKSSLIDVESKTTQHTDGFMGTVHTILAGGPLHDTLQSAHHTPKSLSMETSKLLLKSGEKANDNNWQLI